MEGDHETGYVVGVVLDPAATNPLSVSEAELAVDPADHGGEGTTVTITGTNFGE